MDGCFCKFCRQTKRNKKQEISTNNQPKFKMHLPGYDQDRNPRQRHLQWISTSSTDDSWTIFLDTEMHLFLFTSWNIKTIFITEWAATDTEWVKTTSLYHQKMKWYLYVKLNVMLKCALCGLKSRNGGMNRWNRWMGCHTYLSYFHFFFIFIYFFFYFFKA